MEKMKEQLKFEVDEFFREFPKFQIGSKTYYQDKKRREYRNIINPDDRITFEEHNIIMLAHQILNRCPQN